MNDASSPQWLTPAELSYETTIPERTLSQWRYLGKGPRYARFGRHVRYARADVDAWATTQLVEPSRAAS